jgi:hypothetical protein
MENVMQKKKIWAGVVNGQINFYNSNPQGNVAGLQGSRPFTLTGNGELQDDNGNNAILSTSEGQGTDSAGSVGQSQDDAAIQQHSNQGGNQTA